MKNNSSSKHHTRPVFDAPAQAGIPAIDTSTIQSALLPRTFIAPLDILLEVSTKCNFTCLHCYNTSHAKGVLFDAEHFSRLTDDIIALQPLRCCFSGGEPFLFPDRIMPAARRMRKSGILTSAITNGWVITQDMASEISEAFVGIQVSVDGSTAEIHDRIRNKKGAFKRAIAALTVLSDKVTHLQAACVATSLNYQQMPDLASLLVSIGIVNLVVQPVVPLGRARRRPDLCLTSTMLHKLVELVAEARLSFVGKLRIDILDPLQCAKRHMMSGGTPNQQMYIAANGEIFCIPFLSVEAGNYRERSLRYIWHTGLESYFQRADVKKYLTDLEG